ncbi:membrane protein [Parapedobacter defluvii]|uniref:Membrane protein n=1 Tax=Parapedobacter defluvii TaxID=2045106 RepID=A0ABQ1M612_9SPHI|nr:RagB/SusD family nutrient uptake outer membrane protein [Parapedobacter defluvii]GGC33324.1 membrane protein [Parapedobacter defluvii]
MFDDDITAAAVLTGIYTNMCSGPMDAARFVSLSLLGGLSADELTLHSADANPSYVQYYQNSLSASTLTQGFDYWSWLYPIIFKANAAIDGLEKSTKLTPIVKQRLLGEAKFIRAFCYFYLVNFYGDTPLVLGVDWKDNAAATRMDGSVVYQQIISDLKDAQRDLSENYLDANVSATTSERVRPNKWAATAMLARVYLYTGDYAGAEIEATAVIQQSDLYGLSSLNDVFLKNSREAIWQLQPILSGANTPEGILFIIPETGPNENSWPVYLSEDLLGSFEEEDQRKSEWVGNVDVNGITFYYPYKYKVSVFNQPITEYSMVLRLAEQYLIRAEALAQQDKLVEAASDLVAVRGRAGLGDVEATTKSELLDAILHERRIEFFTESGHRWLDLKRTGSVNEVMAEVTPRKGGTWDANWQWYPILQVELEKAPQLIQNSGY